MTRIVLRLLLVSLVAWLACFVVLARLGTWAPFAFVGLGLGVAMLRRQAIPVSLFRPTSRATLLGVLSGVTMVLLTHWLYGSASVLVPSVVWRTRELLQLLEVTGFAPAQRAVLIVVIASCEEVLFRGPLPALAPGRDIRPGLPSAREWRRILGFAAVYALTTLPLGSALLLICALCCGIVWGALRVGTGSLVAPILAHVLWDLGVLLVWPLDPR